MLVTSFQWLITFRLQCHWFPLTALHPLAWVIIASFLKVVSDNSRAAITPLQCCHSACRSGHVVAAVRSTIYRRPPALLQLQHLLQYQRSLPTSTLLLSLLIHLSQASSAVTAIASLAVPAVATKVEAPVISSASTASAAVAVSAIATKLRLLLSLLLRHFSPSICRRFPVLLLLQRQLQCFLSLPRSRIQRYL